MNFARNTSNVLAAALLCCASSTVSAADAVASGTASYQVLQPLEISEVVKLNFGKIDRPIGGAQRFVVSTSGETSITSDGGNGGAFISGHTAGSFSVTGTAGETVGILRTVGARCSNSTVVLDAVSVDSQNEFKLPTTIRVGGTLIVSNLSTPGSVTCPYRLTAVYQ